MKTNSFIRLDSCRKVKKWQHVGIWLQLLYFLANIWSQIANEHEKQKVSKILLQNIGSQVSTITLQIYVVRNCKQWKTVHWAEFRCLSIHYALLTGQYCYYAALKAAIKWPKCSESAKEVQWETQPSNNL